MTSDSFASRLAREGHRLQRSRTRILQLNLGKLCNLTCSHCHVNAGPARREIITRETIDRILHWFESNPLPVVDLTGGAPEMVPDFRYLISRLREISPDVHIIDRCNLTILVEKGYEWLPGFLADHRIEVVASMPCYSPENVNQQRGDGVFDNSIRGLQILNQCGYARPGSDLKLHLVYNPVGDFLPGPQKDLEKDYKTELLNNFGILFSDLLTITNMPIARFAAWLRREGRYESYLELLRESFNRATVDGLMCRDTVSVSWEGELYDCDFNQMLGLPMGGESWRGRKLWEVTLSEMEFMDVCTGDHCFGCTAGSGSSCGGALVEEPAMDAVSPGQ